MELNMIKESMALNRHFMVFRRFSVRGRRGKIRIRQIMSDKFNPVLVLLFAISRRVVRYDLIKFINKINDIKIRNQRLI